MRSPDDQGFGPRIALPLTLALALAGCGTLESADSLAVEPLSPNGPQADYPVVVGAPYAVAGVSFTPEDVLNYDQVGYIAADAAVGSAVSGAHHTLPLPSYVEVTSLTTGKTILVRLERRGPMDGTDLVALSPGALAQLEASTGTPVRVRRVNPPEEQRALLRAGQQAPLRLETPTGLVEVLKRKLPAPIAAPAPQIAAAAVALAPTPATPVQQADRPAPRAATPAPRTGRFVVQAAAFSNAASAEKVAGTLGGEVSRFGQFFRVRTGPFATRGEAEASLAKVRAAGYSDARIQTSG